MVKLNKIAPTPAADSASDDILLDIKDLSV